MSPFLAQSELNEKVISGAISSPENDVTSEILSFQFLPHGWDFGAGDPVRPEMIKKALEIHEIGLSLGLLTEATPEVDGGITLIFLRGEDTIDIRLHPDFTYTVTHERGIGIEYERVERARKVSRSVALEYLYKLNPVEVEYTICRSCEFLEQRDIAGERDDLRSIPALVTTITTFPLWTWIASIDSRPKYATT